MRLFAALLLPLTLLAGDDREQLLHPSSIPPASRALERSEFADPPAEFRSMPLWVWNDEHTWPRLKEQLEQFKQQGMGGVFVHPRPGLMTEYLGEDWFKLWKQSMEEGKRLGLLVNIYDENSYPAGFAGGHVPSRAPDTTNQYVEVRQKLKPEQIPWNGAETVAVFAVMPDGKQQRVRSRADVPDGATLTLFQLRRASGNPWTAEFPYVDLTNPRTAPMFIETTFEAYKRALGDEFGKTVRWAFDDEPLIATAGAYDSAALSLPLSYNTLAEFRRRCGYDLADQLPSLFWDTGDFRRVRFDYWQTLHDLWKENYFRPLFQWCDNNKLQFTGHWMEHEWPYPWISPADASLYAYEHVPGIDMLEGSNIRQHGADPHMLFTIKQVASVSHQLGRRAFCEAYGVAGWDSTFEHYKRFGDWLMVHGINFMDQHLAFSTVRGARKRDHPQSFTDISPWWPYYRLHGDHLGRVSYMLTRGEARPRLVLIEPTTSGFLVARRDGKTPELEAMRKDNAELIQSLADRQIDFDLADEYILEWFGKAAAKRLEVGQAKYDLVLWPKNMTNVRHETLPVLESYLAAGGEVLALDEPAAYVDGRPNEAVRALRDRFKAQWHTAAAADAAAEVARRLAPRVTFDHALPQGVGFAERFLENGDRVLFFANTGLAAVQAKATVEGVALDSWDTVAGRVAHVPTQAAAAGHIRFDLDLPAAGSRMFVVARKAAAPVRSAPKTVWASVTPGEWKIAPDAANVLVLDYCDLTLRGAEYRDVNTWRANWTLWQSHGFVRPAWDNAVQFKTGVFDRNHFDAASGFEATFRFVAADAAALEGLELAVELPELYKVSVNGHDVSFADGARWLDPHMRSVAVAQHARVGENMIKITGRPFDVRMELENIYLRGKFSVVAADGGFRIAAPSKLVFGPWARQGYPFFAGSVQYESTVNVARGNRLRVTLPKWNGSLAEVLIDGKQAALIAWQPHTAEFAATPGRHAVAVRVVSTPRNLFGPFHNPDKPRMRAWPGAWAQFPEHAPAGSAYDVLDYGLFAPPVIEVGRGPAS